MNFIFLVKSLQTEPKIVFFFSDVSKEGNLIQKIKVYIYKTNFICTGLRVS